MRRVGEDLVKGQPNATDEALNNNVENDVYLRYRRFGERTAKCN